LKFCSMSFARTQAKLVQAAIKKLGAKSLEELPQPIQKEILDEAKRATIGLFYKLTGTYGPGGQEIATSAKGAILFKANVAFEGGVLVGKIINDVLNALSIKGPDGKFKISFDKGKFGSSAAQDAVGFLAAATVGAFLADPHTNIMLRRTGPIMANLP